MGMRWLRLRLGTLTYEDWLLFCFTAGIFASTAAALAFGGPTVQGCILGAAGSFGSGNRGKGIYNCIQAEGPGDLRRVAGRSYCVQPDAVWVPDLLRRDEPGSGSVCADHPQGTVGNRCIFMYGPAPWSGLSPGVVRAVRLVRPDSEKAPYPAGTSAVNYHRRRGRFWRFRFTLPVGAFSIGEQRIQRIKGGSKYGMAVVVCVQFQLCSPA